MHFRDYQVNNINFTQLINRLFLKSDKEKNENKQTKKKRKSN